MAGFVLHLIWATLSGVGHFALAVWVYNRLHAVPWRPKLIKALEKLLLLAAAMILALFVWRWFGGTAQSPLGRALLTLLDAYALVCCVSGVLVIPLWLVPKLRERVPAALVSNHTDRLDLAERLGHRPIGKWPTAVAARIPGNEILKLHLQRKTLRVPRLPPALAGLKIAHLTDLHMTGKLTPAFYNEVVDLTNDERPDLIAITGDIAEKVPCLDWIEPTLGRLRAPLGVYYVLGNHELRLPDAAILRRILQRAGLIDIASRWQWIDEAAAPILIAGTERPWFGANPTVPPRGADDARSESLRILLSHTPDQYDYAQQSDFDLMLAGHNHGGQIRLPWLGALITPSRYGCKYAGGLYHEEPTLLHVSRGVGGVHSVRFNCPPELALLVLTRDE